MRDNGGKRIGMDRRQYSYSGHIPERRISPERRSGIDRRNSQDRRKERRLEELSGPKDNDLNSIDKWEQEERRRKTERRLAFA